MRNLKKGHYRVVDMHLFTIINYIAFISTASIVGLVPAMANRLPYGNAYLIVLLFSPISRIDGC